MFFGIRIKKLGSRRVLRKKDKKWFLRAKGSVTRG
jgi:hypothetical protein